MKKVLFILGLSFSLCTQALAYSQGDVEQLKNTNSCPGGDLSGAFLQDADLTGANLSDANLSYANLSNTVLENANLTKANLQKANFRRNRRTRGIFDTSRKI